MSTKQSIPEHMRWYVVGAHLAGAVDSQIMEMTDLTKGSIRQIIQNFKRTGSPSIARLAPPDDPHYAVIAETAFENNTALDTDQDNKYKRRRVASRKIYTAAHVVQHILDESQQTKQNQPKPSSQPSSTTTVSTKRPSPSPSTKPAKTTKSTQKSSTKSNEWTRQDDLILLQHAWTRFPKTGPRWYEVEKKLKGRHTEKDCEDRWNMLRPILMKNVERFGAEGW